MRRLFHALLALACPALLAAQTPDSVRTDSAGPHYSTATRSYFTRVVASPPRVDTVPAPLPRGVDSTTTGDTTHYTAWSTGRVTDSTWVRLKPPVVRGIPFGPSALYATPTGSPQAPGFSATLNYADPGGLMALLANLRSRGQSAFLAMTGGSHDPYLTAGKFDLAKWKVGTARYSTATLRSAIATAVADGTLLGYVMLDEPQHPSWGGVVSKAVLDSMARYSRSLYPTLPTGVAMYHGYRASERFHAVDFVLTQTWLNTITGSPTAFRDGALRQAALDGVALAFAINLYAGPTVVGCDPAPDAGFCLLTAAEIRSWGSTLGPAGCAFFMWKYSPAIWAKPDRVQAFRDVGALLAVAPRTRCVRP